jgi:hypothetical protein
MSEFDPNGIFMNDFGRRLQGKGTRANTDPLTKHCAILDYCLCSSDSDCANGLRCSRLFGYPDFPVCREERIPLRRPFNPFADHINPKKIIIKFIKEYIKKRLSKERAPTKPNSQSK